MAKNLFAKARTSETPYAIYAGWGPFGLTECRILKTYQLPANEAKNKYARWFLAVKTDMTYGSFDLGDTYKEEVLKGYGVRLVAAEPEWLEAYGVVSFVPTPSQWIEENK